MTDLQKAIEKAKQAIRDVRAGIRTEYVITRIGDLVLVRTIKVQKKVVK